MDLYSKEWIQCQTECNSACCSHFCTTWDPSGNCYWLTVTVITYLYTLISSSVLSSRHAFWPLIWGIKTIKIFSHSWPYSHESVNIIENCYMDFDINGPPILTAMVQCLAWMIPPHVLAFITHVITAICFLIKPTAMENCCHFPPNIHIIMSKCQFWSCLTILVKNSMPFSVLYDIM